MLVIAGQVAPESLRDVLLVGGRSCHLELRHARQSVPVSDAGLNYPALRTGQRGRELRVGIAAGEGKVESVGRRQRELELASDAAGLRRVQDEARRAAVRGDDDLEILDVHIEPRG